MEVRSFVRNAPVSAKKVNLILDQIRGKRVDEALTILRFMTSPKARIVAKAVRSAAANAENNYNLDPRRLRIVACWAGEGIRLKRLNPRARGRADIIQKRRANITIVVDEV
ncbi:MAG: 50S ribosomal protein L22 [Dehalococcoidia bacterium]|jgi:large subunit ribosomal protein L22|nr:50S ribosomal protein L22 [Dehalococcoidia bacterium]MDW8008235.1 50S ribosomal protein L22 [Chloroflexota bacterium]